MTPGDIDALLDSLAEATNEWVCEAIDDLADAIKRGRIVEVKNAAWELSLREAVQQMLGNPPFDIPNLIAHGALRPEAPDDMERHKSVLRELSDILASSQKPDRESLFSMVEEAEWGTQEDGPNCDLADLHQIEAAARSAVADENVHMTKEVTR